MISAICDRLSRLLAPRPGGSAGGRRAHDRRRPLDGVAPAPVPCNMFSGYMIFGYRQDA
jgi:hypothetical protein